MASQDGLSTGTPGSDIALVAPVKRVHRYHRHKPDRRKFLCCSGKPPKPNQMDFFPKQWCNDCCCVSCVEVEDSEKVDYEETSIQKALGRCVWKICFFSLCCPVCYPCYVSRTYRQRHKLDPEERIQKATKYSSLERSAKPEDMRRYGARSRPQKQPQLVKESSSRIEDTLLDHVSKSKSIRTRSRKHSEEETEKPNVINVNVIILKTEVSYLLQRILSESLGLSKSPSASSLVEAENQDRVDGSGVVHNLRDRLKSPKFLEVPGIRRPSFMEKRKGFQVQKKSFSYGNDRSNFRDTALSSVAEDDENDLGLEKEPIDVNAIVEKDNESESSEEFQDCHSVIYEPPQDKQGPSVVVSHGAQRLPRRSVLFRMNSDSNRDENDERRESLAQSRRLSEFGKSFRKAFRSLSTSRRPSTVESAELNEDQEIGHEMKELKSSQPERSSNAHNANENVKPGKSGHRKNSFIRTGFRKFSMSRRASSREVDERRRTWRRKVAISDPDGRESRKYYSVQDEEVSIPVFDFNLQDKVEMRDLGQRTEIVRDLGYQLQFSLYDEASVSQWTGDDLSMTKELPNMDLIVLAVKQGDAQDLNNVMNTSSGLMSYFAKFWRGFFPILFVELTQEQKREDSEYEAKIELMEKFFSDIWRIKIPERRFEESSDWIIECIARLYIHSRLFQCSRFFGKDILKISDPCPGGCNLRKQSKRKKHRRLTRKRPVVRKPSTMHRDVYLMSKMTQST